MRKRCKSACLKGGEYRYTYVHTYVYIHMSFCFVPVLFLDRSAVVQEDLDRARVVI